MCFAPHNAIVTMQGVSMAPLSKNHTPATVIQPNGEEFEDEGASHGSSGTHVVRDGWQKDEKQQVARGEILTGYKDKFFG